jgi:hypothetical protein
MTTRTLGKSAVVATQITTGTYTGDGAATQAIAGVGFLPRFVFIYREDGFVSTPGHKNDRDGLNTSFQWDGGSDWRYRTDQIISLDADGFTVGDGSGSWNTFNVNLVKYHYVCFG